MAGEAEMTAECRQTAAAASEQAETARARGAEAFSSSYNRLVVNRYWSRGSKFVVDLIPSKSN